MSNNNLNNTCYDLVVIGGGIHGCGIAADAAGRGLKVLLCEQADLAHYTSSSSSKLIHGGLRYLEQKDFRLVHTSLAEREILMRRAPHLVEPMRFILPYRPHLRTAWLIRAGLFIYDFLAKAQPCDVSQGLDINPTQSPLRQDIVRAFEYTDCRTDDARLVVLNALLAAEHGAKILTRTRCVAAHRASSMWHITLLDQYAEFHIQAKALVNAAGPWVNQFIENNLQLNAPLALRYVQGSHIVLPKLYVENNAYILQNEDRRVVFVIPYLNDYSLIGTTDYEYTSDPAQAAITDQERDYLLASLNSYFKKQVTAEDIVYDFSGVRVLVEDHAQQLSKNSREYVIHLDLTASDIALSPLPLVSIFGGKLTTYRRLSEQVMHKLRSYFPEISGDWTKYVPLPGAEGFVSHAQLVEQLMQEILGLPLYVAQRWSHSYGTRVWLMLNQCSDYAECGQDFGGGLRALELDYLLVFEWVQQAEDVLWRRTNLGLVLSEAQVLALQQYIEQWQVQAKKQLLVNI